MRIWSLHPKYLDAKGLVALWRETLLAKNVLLGNTRGYVHHPQLERFRTLTHPVQAIDQYLSSVFDEAVRRDYSFNQSKFNPVSRRQYIQVTDGQINHEWQHLMQKLKLRDCERFNELHATLDVCPHPMFHVVTGGVAPWEKL